MPLPELPSSSDRSDHARLSVSRSHEARRPLLLPRLQHQLLNVLVMDGMGRSDDFSYCSFSIYAAPYFSTLLLFALLTALERRVVMGSLTEQCEMNARQCTRTSRLIFASGANGSASRNDADVCVMMEPSVTGMAIGLA